MVRSMMDTMQGPDDENAVNDYIKLDQFLKVVGLVTTGGQAKVIIQAGNIRVNGTIETRRGCKLRNGDVVEAFGEGFTVELAGDDAWA
jgi:ribosome-associated protein